MKLPRTVLLVNYRYACRKTVGEKPRYVMKTDKTQREYHLSSLSLNHSGQHPDLLPALQCAISETQTPPISFCYKRIGG